MSDALAQYHIYGERVQISGLTLPQNDQTPLFDVFNGRVIVTGLIGEVTSAISGTTVNVSLIANPNVGSDSVISGANSMDGKPVGHLVGITGVGASTYLRESVVPFGSAFVVKAGSIDILVDASDAMGAIAWTLFYVPLDDGAYVEGS